MLRWLIHRQLASLERQLGESVDNLRYFAKHSLGGFLRFGMIMPASGYRRAAPCELFHTVGLVAAQAEDCGPCVQIGVNLARKDRVPPELIRAVLNGDMSQMPDGVALAYRFARSIIAHDGEDEPLRQELRQRFGEAAVCELALALTIARVYPTLKRGLGYAKTCSRVHIDGETTTSGTTPYREHVVA